MKAIILAAGLGTRMGPLTDSVPKPLLTVAGEPLVVHQIKRLVLAGVTEAVVNVARHGDKIREALGTGERWGISLHFSDEGPVPLETGGGILRALSNLGPDPFYVVNADVMTDFDLDKLQLEGADGVLALVPNPVHHPKGDFSLAGDGLLATTGPRLTYAGIALLTPALFVSAKPGAQPLKPFLDAALARGALRGIRHDGRWIDVGTAERLELARREFS